MLDRLDFFIVSHMLLGMILFFSLSLVLGVAGFVYNNLRKNSSINIFQGLVILLLVFYMIVNFTAGYYAHYAVVPGDWISRLPAKESHFIYASMKSEHIVTLSISKFSYLCNSYRYG